VALRPRLSPGVPLSWDWQSELQSGAEAVKRPERGSMRVSSGNVEAAHLLAVPPPSTWVTMSRQVHPSDRSSSTRPPTSGAAHAPLPRARVLTCFHDHVVR